LNKKRYSYPLAKGYGVLIMFLFFVCMIKCHVKICSTMFYDGSAIGCSLNGIFTLHKKHLD